jgi:hypothetical protein
MCSLGPCMALSFASETNYILSSVKTDSTLHIVEPKRFQLCICGISLGVKNKNFKNLITPFDYCKYLILNHLAVFVWIVWFFFFFFEGF